MSGKRKRASEEMRRYNEALGRRIAGARKASGLKCKELAAKARITPSNLYWYESGRANCPPLVAARIARALQISVSSLYPKFADEAPQPHAK